MYTICPISFCLFLSSLITLWCHSNQKERLKTLVSISSLTGHPGLQLTGHQQYINWKQLEACKV